MIFTHVIEFKNVLKALPELPGVYEFLDTKGSTIYVGKAKNLKKRVSSYFLKTKHESFKTKLLVNQISKIKHTVVESETDALLLENNLIKNIQPKYNILLKDDKTFPWICIKNENYPRVFSTRKIIKDGSEYFGPYTSALMVKTLITLIRQLYKIRTCKYKLTRVNISEKKFTKCLEYHIGNCMAPCEALQSEEEYSTSILQIKRILKGNIQEVIDHLNQLMYDRAKKQRFEEAESIKQKIEILENFKSKSTIVNDKINNIDVFSYVDDEDKKHVYINYLKIIKGAIVQSHTVEIVKKLDESREDILTYAILNIRERVSSNSREILIPFQVELKNNYKLSVPSRGDKKKLLDLSARNALQYKAHRNKILSEYAHIKAGKSPLLRLQNDLRLTNLPVHIECFDNSNIQGINPVAACVVFKNGKPLKSQYRHYHIKSISGINDFASIEEVVFRRYKRLIKEKKDLPNLIVIDGGKGQLSSAKKSLEKLDIEKKVSIIGIAKKLEEIYFPGDSIPIYIDKNSPGLKILQHIRNEAHRFGITFHRNIRSKEFLKTELENLNGIGSITIQKLYSKFKSLERMKKLEIDELKEVVGNRRAKLLYDYFRK